MVRRISVMLMALAAFFSSGFLLTPALAQTTGDISVSISPEHPGPSDTVTLTLSSFSSNLSAASISWTLDGKPVASAVGQTTLTFTAKDAGVPSTAVANITLVDGTPVQKTVTITPMGVDLLWQAVDSVVPPLYRGKALPGSESTIKFVAIPNIKASDGSLASAGSLLYSWKRNYNADGANSGYGKSSFTVDTSYLNTSEHIDVEADSRDGRSSAANSVTIATVPPKVMWYAESPLYGPLFNNALGNDYVVSGSEAAIIAEPYFFSPSDPASTQLTYDWTLNGNAVDAQSAPNKLYLHRDSTTSGDAAVKLSIKNLSKLFQEATAALTLHLK